MINFNETLFFLMSCLLCSFGFFSAIRISGLVVSLFLFVLSFFLIFYNKGKIKINNIYCIWLFVIFMMIIYSYKLTIEVVAYAVWLLALIFMSVVITSHIENFKIETIIKTLIYFSSLTIIIVFLESLYPSIILSIFAPFYVQDFYFEELNRVYSEGGFRGLSVFPNVISMAGAILISYALFILSSTTKLKKALLFIISVIGIILSGERSNLVLLPLSIGLSYYLGNNKNRLIRVLKIIGLVILILLSLFFLYPYLLQFRIFERVFSSIAMLLAGEDVSNGRLHLYISAINSWQQSPFFGNGWFYFLLNNRGALGRDVLVHAHNLIFELLCDWGLIGMCFILLPLLYSLFLNIKAARNLNQTTGIFYMTLVLQVYFLLDSLLHVTFYSLNMISFYFIFILIFYYSLKKINKESLAYTDSIGQNSDVLKTSFKFQ